MAPHISYTIGGTTWLSNSHCPTQPLAMGTANRVILLTYSVNALFLVTLGKFVTLNRSRSVRVKPIKRSFPAVNVGPELLKLT